MKTEKEFIQDIPIKFLPLDIGVVKFRQFHNAKNLFDACMSAGKTKYKCPLCESGNKPIKGTIQQTEKGWMFVPVKKD